MVGIISAGLCRRLLQTLALLAAGTVCGRARSAEPYTWSAVSIGGGGYVTGQAIHATVPDVHFLRCDVGGVFRWSASSGAWEPMLDWVNPDDSNLSGCDGLALHPGNPDVVFALLGRYAYQTPSGLYKSTDRGATWRLVLSTRCASNSDQRWLGEPVAFDPENPETVYCGTRTNGLHKSTDGGETWTKLASLASGDTGSGSADNYATYPIGIRTVLAAPGGVVYAGLFYRTTNSASGVYRSTDGGTTFSQLADAPAAPARFAFADGMLYVTHDAGVAKFDGAGWTDITPPGETGQKFCALAIDPADGAHILVSRYAYASGQAMYRSTDGGAAWSANLVSSSASYPEASWFPGNHKFAATATLAFDPHAPGAVYYGDWYAVWGCPDISASAPAWSSLVNGLETSVVVNLLCPPASTTSGQVPALMSGFADIIGFRHFDHWRFPTSRVTTTDAEGISADFCETAPQNLAVVTADDWYGAGTRIITSADGGATWTQRGIPTISGDTVELGRIAVDRTNPAKMVYVPYLPSSISSARIYYTTNSGQKWAKSGSSVGGRALTQNTIFDPNQPLCADRNTDSRFFLYNKANGGLYRSTNGGQSWSDANGGTANPLPVLQSGNQAVLTTAPGRVNEVWISLGWQGLWRSTDSGATFSQISAFSVARSIGWGKPESGTASIPYVFGKYNGVWGVWRSTDLSTWERINDDAHAFGNETKVVAADRQVYGRVYLGSNGNGIRLGQPWPERTWEQWRANRFTAGQREATVGNVSTANGDPDGDGVENLLEYALGGDPVGANLLPESDSVAVNGDFEAASLDPWGGGGSWGTFSRSATGQQSGSACVRLEPSSGCHQVLGGLLPGTAYRITANLRSESGGPVNLGVRNHGGPEVYASVSSTTYSTVTLDFSTAGAVSSAEIYLYRSSSGTGGAWADNVSVNAVASFAGSFSPGPANEPPRPKPGILTDSGGSFLTLEFDRLRPDVSYLVQAGDDPATWTTTATNPGAVNSTVTHTDSANMDTSARRFLRLKITRP
jgi:hypothetical protein